MKKATHKVVAREACNVLCEKSCSSTKRVPTIQKELQQREKINSSMREAIQLKNNGNNTRGAEATQEEQKQHQKKCHNVRRATQHKKSNVQSTNKSKNNAKPTTKNKTNNRRTLQDQKKS
jgi:hypothetical protein